MNKNILVIEPQEFLYKKLLKIALDEGDNIYFISLKSISLNDEKILRLDLLNSFEDSCTVLKKIVRNDKFYIFTANESYLLVSEKLKRALNIVGDQIINYTSFRDKHLMKKYFMENNINTAKSVLYKTSKDVLNDIEKIKFPVIVKPIGGFASCGVKKVTDKTELLSHFKKITLLNISWLSKTNNNNTGILIEEYIEGDEYAIDTIWFKGKPVLEGIFSKGNDIGPYFPDKLYCVEPDLSKNVREVLLKESRKIVNGIEDFSGASHTEVRIKNGIPYVIETTLRPGAGGYLYEVLSKAHGVNFLDVYYFSMTCDDENEFQNKIIPHINKAYTNMESFCWYNMTLEQHGIIKEVNNIEAIMSRKEVVSCELLQSSGDIIYPQDLNSSYFFWIIFKLDGNVNYLKEGNSLVEIYDSLISVKFEGEIDEKTN
jgi:ATP-grasp domain